MFVDSDEAKGLPSLVAESGHTVWGGIFDVPHDEVGALTDAEEGEGRVADWDVKAVDRGRKQARLPHLRGQGLT